MPGFDVKFIPIAYKPSLRHFPVEHSTLSTEHASKALLGSIGLSYIMHGFVLPSKHS
jgi:hypothetical protein